MSNTTEHFAIEDLRRIARLVAAGLTAAQIARRLQDEGVEVPRDGAFDHRHSAPSGYNLPTHAGDPSRWTSEAVDAVVAAPEYDAANGYAAARATLGSDTMTLLTID